VFFFSIPFLDLDLVIERDIQKRDIQRETYRERHRERERK
jgi:hypothetical protein